MKTKYSFEFMELDDGMVAVPVGENSHLFNGVLKVNDTAVEILKLLEHDTSEEQIAADILKDYAGDPEQIHTYLHEFLEKLKAEDILE